MKKTLLINRTGDHVRAISFNGNSTDPYVIYHLKPEELSDNRLREHYEKWLEINDDPKSAEEFEEFLFWLAREKGYFDLITSDAMINFGSENYRY